MQIRLNGWVILVSIVFFFACLFVTNAQLYYLRVGAGNGIFRNLIAVRGECKNLFEHKNYI